MSHIDDLAKDFLAQQHIAVAGVSDSRETTGNFIYKALRSRGYTVYGINPHTEEFHGDPCYPDVASLPEKPDGLVIVTRPAIAEDLVRQCVKAGVPRVWLHSMLGTRPHLFKGLADKIGSVSPEAVRICQENGIEVIPGSCPMQFLGEDFGHTCMRGFLRMTGALEVPEGVGMAAA
jgi:predicted CoA-binding protein